MSLDIALALIVFGNTMLSIFLKNNKLPNIFIAIATLLIAIY
jgi:hypothetical protein